jgi:N-acetyl-anhydromuramyl-L-alanine amidase AmpD
MRWNVTRALSLGAISLFFLSAPSVVHAGPKPPATWEPASRSNYHRGRSERISMVVIHTIEGSFQSGINTFQNPGTKVSAHYVISQSGRIVQMVGDNDTAYHVRSANPHALGIEHEGFLARREMWTDPMYRASAKLCRWLCDTYSIPIDRRHILGHNEVPWNNHADPGRFFDWDYYMRLVRGEGGAASPDPGATGSDPSASPGSGSGTDAGGTGQPGSGTSSSDGSGSSGSGDTSGTAGSNGSAGRKKGIRGRLAGENEDTPDREDPTHAVLSKNSRGERVEELQKLLNKAGYDLDEDGVFGGETDKAVRAFQRAHGLPVDGIVGGKTWRALDKLNNPAPATPAKSTATKRPPRRPADGPLGAP